MFMTGVLCTVCGARVYLHLGLIVNLNVKSFYIECQSLNLNVNKYIKGNFYTPVFRRDVLWYGDVRPSGSPSDSPRPTLRQSVRPGLRPPVFRTFLIHALTY